MSLQVLPAGEADMYRAAVVERAAYSPLEANGILFPGPLPPDILKYRAEGFRKEAEDPKTFWYKVVDTELEADGQSVAFAKWIVHDGSDSRKSNPARDFPPGANAEACKLLFGAVAEMNTRQVADRPHISLAMLYTDPKHQGRGAGTLLLKKLIEESVQIRLPAYLDASESGHALYLRHGFQDLEELVTDFSPWGMTKPHRVWTMVREP